jgi:RND family efflux transporter MFP subunit
MNETIPPSDAEKRHPKLWLSLKIILPLVVLALGALILFVMVETAPTADRQPPARTARLVDVTSIDRADVPAIIQAMGLVQPAREVTLQPQVSGRVMAISDELIPGGLKNAGDMLIIIERVDYEIAVRKAESDLATAESEYALEMGQQAVARNDFALLGDENISPEERALIMRDPQLGSAKAQLDRAKAALDQAKLNLERTTVTAPFNAVIRERHVHVGAQVNPATPLVTLTDADAYWIIAPVPVSQLRWLSIPQRPGETGSAVRVHIHQNQIREGRVLRRFTNLEEGGRMAQVLIEVDDPLARRPEHHGQSPLLIGDFVRVEITGITLPDVMPLDRRWLRGQDRVWVINEHDELDIRPVEILFRGEHDILVGRGIDEGDRIVTTDLSAPVAGMKITAGRAGAGGSP